MRPSQAMLAGSGRRKAIGAWYTPPALVDHVVERAIAGSVVPGSVVRVLDPACGDGRFLVACAHRIGELGGIAVLTGIDVDPGAVAAARAALAGFDAVVLHGDALTHDWSACTFDVVIGNPPFLNQMAQASTRGGSSRHGGGPYADAAVEFLAMALRLARPRGGVVAMVLPLSIVASRDAAPVRALACERARLRWAWWSESPVFDADVRTCALGFELGGVGSTVERATGPGFRAEPAAPDPGPTWSRLVAATFGVPSLGRLRTRGSAGDVAAFGANFRDEYYGMVGAVRDDAPGPPLITSGLIDPGRCAWGRRPARFAKQQFQSPRLDLRVLSPRWRTWAERHLRPKVLVANQTSVLEAVVDAAGEWVPSVPVINAVPADPVRVWELGAVLTSPVASAWIHERAAGSGLSSRSVRVSPALLTALPWPGGDLSGAVAALRSGSVSECGRAVSAAYGVADDELLAWWLSAVARATPSPARP